MMRASLALLIVLGALFTLSAKTAAGSTGNVIYFNQGQVVDAYYISATAVPAHILGAPFATGGAIPSVSAIADNIVISPANILYVPDGDSGTIAAFSINSVTGALTPIPGSPFKTGLTEDQVAVAVTPNGKFLYAAFSLHTLILGFAIGPNGALTPLPGRPVQGGSVLGYDAISPDSTILGVSLPDGGAVLTYVIAPDGALSEAPGSPFAVLSGFSLFSSISISPNNLMLGGTGSPQVTALSIAPNGKLTLAPSLTGGGPLSTGLGALTPNGSFFYQLPEGFNSLFGYAVSPGGEITALPGSPVPVRDVGIENAPTTVAISADGTTLFLQNVDGDLSVFNISASGLPVEAPGSPLNINAFGGGMVVYPVPGQKQVAAPTYNVCISDQFTGDMIQFDSASGDYRYANCHTGVSMVGRGSVTSSSCYFVLNDVESDRKLVASWDTCNESGSAAIRSTFLKLAVDFSANSAGQCNCKGE
ncbi:MAG TPA: hypothetical protein VI756_02525 [Blastocatellia bacterium]